MLLSCCGYVLERLAGSSQGALVLAQLLLRLLQRMQGAEDRRAHIAAAACKHHKIVLYYTTSYTSPSLRWRLIQYFMK